VGGRRLDLICLGRAAVDLYGEQVGGRLEDVASFAKSLGGCAANTAVGAARLGLRVAMLTRVGDEHMGRFVRETLAAEGVDVSHVATDPTRLTALVVLGIRDREHFPHIFYRENCADMALSPEDFDEAFIGSATALLVTGTHFSTPQVDAASRAAVGHARASGTKVVFDIDYRPVLWGVTGHGAGERRFVPAGHVTATLQSILPACDLVVGTEDEFHVLGGTTDTVGALREVRRLTAAVLVLKRGPMGCAVFERGVPDRLDHGLVAPGFPVEVFNVLGAGDAFMAGFLRGWLRGLPLADCGRLGNACGALVVSRHGCAPAMPSWEELTRFLEVGPATPRVREDAALARLHRVTTRTRPWPEVLALAFDHRRQLEELAARHGVDRPLIARFKALVAEAFASVARGVPGAGAIVDDRYGQPVLDRLTGTGVWLARPIEVPGSVPLAFERGASPAVTLREWPGEHVVKCLVAYHPDDPQPLRHAQLERLNVLHEACVATGHELLLEVVPPPARARAADTLARALDDVYRAGVYPDWWKLPPPPSPEAWRLVAETIARHDRHCRGVLLLGLDAPEAELAAAFGAAGPHAVCRGFAVGRTIFGRAAEGWFAGRVDDEEARGAVAASYARAIELWRAVRPPLH
jgi:5-dehydro-2-deoxygluconokinase